MVESTLQMLQALQNGKVRNVPADMGDLTLRVACKISVQPDVGGRSEVVGEGLNAVMHFNTRGRVLLPLAGEGPHACLHTIPLRHPKTGRVYLCSVRQPSQPTHQLV